MPPDDQNPLSATGLVWGSCWRFAVEVVADDLPRLEFLLCNGLGLAPVARDDGFVMLSNVDHSCTMLLRRQDGAQSPAAPAHVLLMTANARDIAARFDALAPIPLRRGSDGSLPVIEYLLSPCLRLSLYECPP